MLWTKEDQPYGSNAGNVFFNNASNATTTVRFLATGNYTLRLTAWDDFRSAHDNLTVTVVEGDDDGDGLSNARELALGTNRTTADSDGDGMSDGFEATHGFDPLEDDENNNSIPDGDDDWDGDGTSNENEETAASDPRDPYNGFPYILSLLSGDFQVVGNGTYLPDPLVFKVSDLGGNATASVPVTFHAPTGRAKLSTSLNGTLSESLTVSSDGNGTITLYLRVE
ncbi:MAG: hypothetical protein HC901_01610 [Bdellovibrionaceae bacterium]|nr:hypothetical protein [Pseudobdellovibrionaceae bacterium]